MTIVSFIALPLYTITGPLTFIILSTIPSSLLWLYLWRNLPETKGKEIGEIMQTLMKEKKNITSNDNIDNNKSINDNNIPNGIV